MLRTNAKVTPLQAVLRYRDLLKSRTSSAEQGDHAHAADLHSSDAHPRACLLFFLALSMRSSSAISRGKQPHAEWRDLLRDLDRLAQVRIRTRRLVGAHRRCSRVTCCSRAPISPCRRAPAGPASAPQPKARMAAGRPGVVHVNLNFAETPTRSTAEKQGRVRRGGAGHPPAAGAGRSASSKSSRPALAMNAGYCAHSGPSRGDPCRRAIRPIATFIAAIRNVRFTAVHCVSSRSASSAIRPLSAPYSPPGRLYRRSAKRQNGRSCDPYEVQS